MDSQYAVLKFGYIGPELDARGDIRSCATTLGAEDNELPLPVHKVMNMRIIFDPNIGSLEESENRNNCDCLLCREKPSML